MIFYNLIKLIVKFAIEIFFDEVEIHCEEYIPKEGPLIIAANHPSSIMDALVVGVKTPRKIHYIGHSGLFSSTVKSKFLYAMGIIPVYRREDNTENVEDNTNMFRAAYKILEGGKCIGIFPEGTSQTDRKVLNLKTGTARIALGAEKQNDFNLGLSIVPLGLYFTARHRFRSKVLLNFGKPIHISDFKEIYEEDEFEGVHKLTERISDELVKLTVNVKKSELDGFVIDLEKIYKANLKDDLDEGELLRSKSDVFKDLYLTQQLADAVTYYMEKSPDDVNALIQDVKNYRLKLDRLQLRDSQLQNDIKKSNVSRRSWKIMLWSIAGFPFWVAGVLTNYIPYKFAGYFGRKVGYEETKTSSALMIGGGFGFLLFYSLETFLVYLYFTPFIAFSFLLMLPVIGFVSLAYVKKLRHRWRMWNFALTILTNKHTVKRLQLERRSIIKRLDQFKEDYLKVIAQSG